MDNSLGYHRPELIEYWHENNNRSIFEVNIHNTEKYRMYCKKDKRHIYTATPSKLSQGRGCPYCSGQKPHLTTCVLTTNSNLVVNEWDWCKNIVEENLTPYDVTPHSDKKVWWKCAKCKQSYRAAVKDRTRKGILGCKDCISPSKCEMIISDILKELKIKYRAQIRFGDCKDKRSLPFDFVLYDMKDNIICIIEYDGEHHFNKWRFKNQQYAEEKLKNTQRRDAIKNRYCEDKKINLLRIPYTYTKPDELKAIIHKYILDIK